MKLEMGESLIYSWLRHEKKCQIVQMNWQPSPKWDTNDAILQMEGKSKTDNINVDIRKYEDLERFMFFTKRYFEAKFHGKMDVFKSNTFPSLLKQAELDALGVCMESSKIKVYAIDVAFHKDGLNYGNGSTVADVLKKLIRAVICHKIYFENTHGEIIFVTPKVSENILEILVDCVADLNKLLEVDFSGEEMNKYNDKDFETESFPNLFIENFVKDGKDARKLDSANIFKNDLKKRQNNNNGSIKVKFIGGMTFATEILDKTIGVSKDVSDTSELFMRGFQLLELCEDVKNKKSKENSKTKKKK